MYIFLLLCYYYCDGDYVDCMILVMILLIFISSIFLIVDIVINVIVVSLLFYLDINMIINITIFLVFASATFLSDCISSSLFPVAI